MEYFTAFQLTTSQGGRHILLNRNTLLRCISTHDLARRSTLKLFHFLARNAYFNSRPRKEVDNLYKENGYLNYISTHDLARRSTLLYSICATCTFISTHDLARRSTDMLQPQARLNLISTHDLARRSTSSCPAAPMRLQLFQLTTSQGGRQNGNYIGAMLNGISTHDLARRSTSAAVAECFAVDYFNSRPRKEVDGARRAQKAFEGDFNSRPRKEVDTYRLPTRQEWDISTHDLARRSTEKGFSARNSERNFNSRPRKEVDGSSYKPISQRLHISTHDLARRSTYTPLAFPSILSAISTHDLARRSTFPHNVHY